MEEEVQSLTCEICVEPMTETKKFSNNKRCAHPFCLDCIVKYIEAKIGENSTAEVPCPASNCDKFLDPISCRPILPAGLFERWCDVLCESAVLRGESSHCYCPSAGCSTLVLNECGGIITKSECPNCKKLFCFQCKITWHVGFGCNETEQLRDENDFLFGELVVRNNWKRCPNCKFRVEKLDGCRSIQCS
ncbi:probable E3 ubiquitin-protein ligase RNF144A isoform X2 [Macadamia integrifolia]|uniref:probable E3 ubiquitin-protein ligase RNF144A isoform X2 n=1 Tax=Macadamia integrifolia TaxID=60698 RepID=UPI001C4F2410|nr:probable E3 ubiquitin-protein ligase RNF144A isoform X2 [Macadamia integrifolia]